MPHLLHLDSSARTDSFSRASGAAFADAWRAARPDAEYTYRDLTAHPVPPIDLAWTEICDTMLREGITVIADYERAVRTPAQRKAWDVVAPLLAELVAADIVLIGAPMYNFGVPAQLKSWIDQVTFPRMVLAPRRFVIASARGGSYLPGTPREPFDHQVRYLVDFFAGHYAVTDPIVLTTELTNALVDPGLTGRLDRHLASAAKALGRAADLGRDLVAGP
jgi:FMN-dependent NADH-azoreductase